MDVRETANIDKTKIIANNALSIVIRALHEQENRVHVVGLRITMVFSSDMY